MNFRNFLLLVLTLCYCALFPGCIDEDEFDFNKIAEIEVQPAYAFPFVNGSLGVRNFLDENDSLALFIRNDGVVVFRYEEAYIIY